MEHRLITRFPSTAGAPVFVTGLPRVGSTLVYLALARALELSFACNAASRRVQIPALVTTALQRTVGISPSGRFESDYGVAPGWNAPSQFREVFGRWFPLDQSYTPAGALSRSAMAELRSTIAAIEAAFGMPFITKGQGHAVRVRPLCEVFPDAVFVRVRRAPLEVAESILRGRRDCFGDEAHWFSAKPSSYALLTDLPIATQIARQMADIDADMDRDFAVVGPARVFEVNYAAFCADPRRATADFADFYEASTGLRPRKRNEIPASFRPSVRRRVDAADSQRLRRALDAAGMQPD